MHYSGFCVPQWPRGSAEKILLCAHSCLLTSYYGLWEALLCIPWSVWLCMCVCHFLYLCVWEYVHLQHDHLCSNTFFETSGVRLCCVGFFREQTVFRAFLTEHATQAKTTTDPSVYCIEKWQIPRLFHSRLPSNLYEEVWRSWLQTAIGAVEYYLPVGSKQGAHCRKAED